MIFERMVFVRLHHHLTINNILANEQFGFRTNSTAEKAINRPLDQTLTALNASHSVAEIFCNLEKGFDCVNFIVKIGILLCFGSDT
jgi:hypothetical protein